MNVRESIEAALHANRPIRLHTVDGEVVVARVLSCDAGEVVYIPLRSSRPERYAVCDATGFALELASLTKAQLL